MEAQSSFETQESAYPMKQRDISE